MDTSKRSHLYSWRGVGCILILKHNSSVRYFNLLQPLSTPHKLLKKKCMSSQTSRATRSPLVDARECQRWVDVAAVSRLQHEVGYSNRVCRWRRTCSVTHGAVDLNGREGGEGERERKNVRVADGQLIDYQKDIWNISLGVSWIK